MVILYSRGITTLLSRKSVPYIHQKLLFSGKGLTEAVLQQQYNVAIVTCAALNPNGKCQIKLTPNGHMPRVAVDIMRNKIRTVFRIGLTCGHDSLVLGAFGCSAFRNPPAEVARIIHEVMEESEFKNKYRLFTFYIIDDQNALNSNLLAFKKEFGFV